MSGTEPATGSYLVEQWEDSGQQSDDVHHRLIHFGVHRRMRMNGVKEGDTVHYVDRELRWEYPRQELEAKVKPAGAWSSTLDGITGYQSIELRAYAAPVEGDEFDESVAEAVPQVVAILMGGKV